MINIYSSNININSSIGLSARSAGADARGAEAEPDRRPSAIATITNSYYY